MEKKKSVADVTVVDDVIRSAWSFGPSGPDGPFLVSVGIPVLLLDMSQRYSTFGDDASIGGSEKTKSSTSRRPTFVSSNAVEWDDADGDGNEVILFFHSSM